MKSTIHPTWHTITVTCVCGNTFESGSTKSAINVDICSKCHPFFTNEMRFVDRQGRVDKFRQAVVNAQARGNQKSNKKKDDKAEKADTQSFRDILKSQKETIAA